MSTTMPPTVPTTMRPLNDYLPTLARVLMCSLFIWDGVLQLRDPAGTVQYFTSLHVPTPQIAVWVSIAIHLFGGLAILVGFMIRWAAALLILLCFGTAFGVHLPAGDMDNMVNFYKNLVMAGGFLYVMAFGAGAIAFDKQRNTA
jgi:putative oxidoreductase